MIVWRRARARGSTRSMGQRMPRCPMLTLNPKMLPCLDELEADLVQRRDHGTANGWRGEIEGIDLSLTFLRSKRPQTHRSVSLGMPTIRYPMARKNHCGRRRPGGPTIGLGTPGDLKSSLRRLGDGDGVGNEEPVSFTPYGRGRRRY
jgi:hypothetical protein